METVCPYLVAFGRYRVFDFSSKLSIRCVIFYSWLLLIFLYFSFLSLQSVEPKKDRRSKIGTVRELRYHWGSSSGREVETELHHHHDNAFSHTVFLLTNFLIPQPSYSADLAFFNLFFASTKKRNERNVLGAREKYSNACYNDFEEKYL